MNRRLLFSAFCLVFLFVNSIQSVSAHLPGQPPFFTVNGVYSPYYRVPTTSLNDFPLPQDMGPAEYVVGKEISLEIVPSQLQVPPEIVKKTLFKWDYGDGAHATGLKNSHAYKKIGSYLISITAEYTDQGQYVPPQLFESVQLDIVPNAGFKMPRAILTINGQVNHDPLNKSIKVQRFSEVTFDASKSTLHAKALSYFWDFGDGITATGESVTHTYKKETNLAFPVLRIKDADGYVIDYLSQIQILDKVAAQVSPTPVKKGSSLNPYLIGGLAAVAVVAAVAVFALLTRKK